ncbi:MAG: RNA pseudouridine synthase [Treponema sp.]|nr:RNA pseudouridine synthase [Treponema sp.]
MTVSVNDISINDISIDDISIDDISVPRILVEEKDYLVVYKPPRMHSAPLARSHGENLLEWCAAGFPEISRLPGRQKGEGGLLHRLDYETHGLMLLARTMRGMEALLEQQKAGKISKEYNAIAAADKVRLPGFPQAPMPRTEVVSAFRPYGRGRRVVRPVLSGSGKPYVTEILENNPGPDGTRLFRLRIVNGFRHQIRCHLAWLGFPILNDELYGMGGDGFLALRATAISFNDPAGVRLRYAIPPIHSNGAPAKHARGGPETRNFTPIQS